MSLFTSPDGDFFGVVLLWGNCCYALLFVAAAASIASLHVLRLDTMDQVKQCFVVVSVSSLRLAKLVWAKLHNVRSISDEYSVVAHGASLPLMGWFVAL